MYNIYNINNRLLNELSSNEKSWISIERRSCKSPVSYRILEVPYSLGIGVKVIAGSSMDAIIGSLISSGMSISEMKSYVVQWI